MRCDGSSRSRFCTNLSQHIFRLEGNRNDDLQSRIKMSVEKEKDKSKVHKLSLKGMSSIPRAVSLLMFI